VATSRIDGDLFIEGTCQARTTVVTAGAVGDAQANASSPFATNKMRHKHRPSNGQGDTAVTAVVPIHVVSGATGLVCKFTTWLSAANTGDASVVVDLLKNGSSILTSYLEITTEAARTLFIATLADTTAVVGDVFEVSVTATAGTGTLGSGLGWQLEIDEDAL
jgi:hypothetical protein